MGHTLRGECKQEEEGKVGNPKLEIVWCALRRGANKVILNWQRSLWEGNWEVVKRYDGDESIWVVTHTCREAMLGISLYSYPYVKLAKTLCLSYYCLCLPFNKIGEEGRTGSAWKQWQWRGEVVGQGEEMAQSMHANKNKWINKPKKFPCRYMTLEFTFS
jgi:hypothetical protein